MPPAYKLTYLPLRGIAEPIRLLFTYATIPFEDNRISREEVRAMETDDNFGKVPILEHNGKRLCESYAILRFLANKLGVAGKDDWEKAHVDAIADYFKDLFYKLVPFLMIVNGMDQKTDRETTFRDVYLVTINERAPKLVQLLKKSKSGFFADCGVTWVDFVIANWVESFEKWDPDFSKRFPELTAHREKIYKFPQLRKYLASRPDTII